MSLLKQCFTLSDNETCDLGRILWAVGVMAFVGLSAAGVWLGKPLDYLAWGGGFGAVMAGGAGAIRLKLEAEKKEQ